MLPRMRGTEIDLSADGSEKESLRICLNDDLHWSSWLDAIESCMSCWPMLVASKSVTLRCVGNVIYQASLEDDLSHRRGARDLPN